MTDVIKYAELIIADKKQRNVNYDEYAKVIGISQASLIRIVHGQSSKLRRKTIKKLNAYFNLEDKEEILYSSIIDKIKDYAASKNMSLKKFCKENKLKYCIFNNINNTINMKLVKFAVEKKIISKSILNANIVVTKDKTISNCIDSILETKNITIKELAKIFNVQMQQLFRIRNRKLRISSLEEKILNCYNHNISFTDLEDKTDKEKIQINSKEIIDYIKEYKNNHDYLLIDLARLFGVDYRYFLNVYNYRIVPSKSIVEKFVKICGLDEYYLSPKIKFVLDDNGFSGLIDQLLQRGIRKKDLVRLFNYNKFYAFYNLYSVCPKSAIKKINKLKKLISLIDNGTVIKKDIKNLSIEDLLVQYCGG